jgi:ATP synthase I chain
LNSSGSHFDSPAEPEETFYVRTYRRLVWMMVALALAGSAGIWIRYGGATALVFLGGGFIAILNFHWLKRTLDAIGEKLQDTGKVPSSWGVVFRFILRYVLIAIAAYVILKSTASNLYGFFAGLVVPVGAILAEAVYETYRALRTGF